MNYPNFRYIFPDKMHPTAQKNLTDFDNGENLLHPAYNGEICVVFTNGFELMVYNHKGKIFRNVSNTIDFRKLAVSGNWFVYTGIYCPKHKNVEPGSFQDQFIITDVLVWDGEYLIGSTLEDRLGLLKNVFTFHPTLIVDCYAEAFQFLHCTDIKGIFRAKYFDKNFNSLYSQIINAKYTGIVIYKKDKKLEPAFDRPNIFRRLFG